MVKFYAGLPTIDFACRGIVASHITKTINYICYRTFGAKFWTKHE